MKQQGIANHALRLEEAKEDIHASCEWTSNKKVMLWGEWNSNTLSAFIAPFSIFATVLAGEETNAAHFKPFPAWNSPLWRIA